MGNGYSPSFNSLSGQKVWYERRGWKIAAGVGFAASIITGGVIIWAREDPDSFASAVDKAPIIGEDPAPETSAAPPPPPASLPPYMSVTGLDHQTVHDMREATPREANFTMEINGITYAWPVGRPDYNLYKIALPCELDMTDPATGQLVPNSNGNTMCHGDPEKLVREGPGSAFAMDFVYRDVKPSEGGHNDQMIKEPVKAITDGTILAIDPGSDDPSCTQIKFQSAEGDIDGDGTIDGDGHVYWYAHLSGERKVAVGDTLIAGQEFAEVGDPSCGGGTVPHLHLKRLIKGETDASYSKADKEFIPTILTPLFNGLYQKSLQGQ